MRALLIAATATLLGVGVASAHGPMRLKHEVTQKLDATPDEVWARIGDFHDMGWHPAIQETVSDGGTLVPDESRRILRLAPDGTAEVEEMLTRISDDDPAKRSYAYMIERVDPAVLPVTNYASTLTVEDEAGQALVRWKAGFYRGFPNNDPPEALNDEAAMAAVEALYAAGMAALVEEFGAAD